MLILKVLVGSRAHGLAGPESDYDYRGVYVEPTSRLLSLGQKPPLSTWLESGVAPAGGKQDDTSWEVGHFLALATHCNPTILELFRAPVSESTDDGLEMRALLDHLWHPIGVRDAFIGYGLNQRKKMLDGKDVRPAKYASTYLRVLYQAHELLRTGLLLVDMRETPVFHALVKWRGGDFTPGEVVDVCGDWERRIRQMAEDHPQRQNLEPINAYLLTLRRRCW